jgi:hypothetical protein
MTGATSPGARPHGTPSPAQQDRASSSQTASPGHEPRDLWPRDFGRDGVSGLVTVDRALRARDVSRPTPEDERLAESVLAELMARVDGRRPQYR